MTKSSSDENQSDSQSLEAEVDPIDPSTVDYHVNHRPMKALVETSKEAKYSRSLFADSAHT